MTAWSVIGGKDRGGVLVRAGPELSSPKLSDRLATGAVVEEIELLVLESAGERLHYRRLSGTGPEEGWITVALDSNVLAERVDEAAVASAGPGGGPPAELTGGGGEASGAPQATKIAAAFHYTASYDQITVEMQAMLEAHGAFFVERVYTTKEMRMVAVPERFHWFHTITKLKDPSDWCPPLSCVAVMPHLYELEEKSLLQKFMNAHGFPACIDGFLFERGAEEASVEVSLRELGFPCIVKPSNEGGRRGIRIAGSPRDVFRAVRAFSRAPVWVVQRLEQPAFLLHGYKFHIRVFAFVHSRDGTTHIHMARCGPVYFSKKAYDTPACKSESHLSGGGGTGYSRTWPAYLEQAVQEFPGLTVRDFLDLLMRQLHEMCNNFLVTVSRGAHFEREAYRLIAFDVLLCAHPERRFQAKVMEVNISPSSEFHGPQLRRDLAQGMLHRLWPEHFPADDVFQHVASLSA
mmetsp:Transcript_92620/g.288762  ORF Transcript_92620/g.288762 Transcript_92620/m.288762 type:complete len:462 (+) Transcript_92620:211-1596(+)